MGFLDEDYLLDSQVAKNLYKSIKGLPILDAHNHADIKEIANNEGWQDIWEVETATDHYVWELMRKRGVPEEKITGQASNYEKWKALCEVFPDIATNPTYEWIHLDLQRRFGIDKLICSENADEIWEETRQALNKDSFKPQPLLKDMNVEILCTTDDPVLSLPYHEKANQELDNIKILPTWRPDKISNIDSNSWNSDIKDLSAETDIELNDINDLMQALEDTHSYFNDLGCVASDHGVEQPLAYQVGQSTANKIFQKAINNINLTDQEIRDYKAFLMHYYAELNAETDWVMQIHIGAVRDYRDKLLSSLGPDSGGDISSQNINIGENLRELLNAYDEKLKIVLYCLDPSHLPTIATIARAFPNVSIGAAWWFNDSPYGMETHLEYTASVDLLSNVAGMVTDSRKLMSYGSRTEMFRRVLANVLGKMVKRGQLPLDIAEKLAKTAAYARPQELFFSSK
jgi:glucuronate isomerase